MVNKKQNLNWIIDAILLIAFLLEFFLKLTGIDLHQWLGIGIGVLILVHFFLHWKWVKGVFRNFFTKCSSQARWFAFLDLVLIIGFVFIGFTGFLISTWFTLNINYIFVIDIHVAVSFITLAVLLVKVALHYKWIVNATQKLFTRDDSRTKKQILSLQSIFPASETLQKLEGMRISRRRFVGFMGMLTAASAVALITIKSNSANASSGEVAQPITPTGTASPTETLAVQSTPTQSGTVQSVATAQPTVTAYPTAAPTAAQCVYRCRKGLHCAYPGRCHDYIDLNKNGLCDNGECL